MSATIHTCDVTATLSCLSTNEEGGGSKTCVTRRDTGGKPLDMYLCHWKSFQPARDFFGVTEKRTPLLRCFSTSYRSNEALKQVISRPIYICVASWHRAWPRIPSHSVLILSAIAPPNTCQVLPHSYSHPMLVSQTWPILATRDYYY